AIYGPRTLLVFSTGKGAHEFTLVNGVWELTAENLKLEGGKNKYFAPGNLRAAKEREDYLELVNSFIKEGYTLRYSGGMVPDIHHSFVKGHGIFMYPGSPAAPQGKLRLLFECAPMAFIAEQAGGAASNGKVDILDIRIESIHQQSPILIGTKEEVQRAALALN
ncbi:MAG: fructose-bisphosphatase class I, partial [Patescibacteria group bacterium]